MKKTLLTLIIGIFLAGNFAYAQETEYTLFSPEEVTKEMFEAEPMEADADAEYLHWTGSSMLATIYQKPHRVTKIKRRIRILTEDAIDTYNEFTVSYYTVKKSGEEIRNIVAKCYNLKGKKVKVFETKEKEFIEETEERESGGQKFKIHTITIPIKEVKVGSIVEFEYEKISPNYGFPGAWTYQKGVPVKYSEYVYESINSYDFYRVENGEEFFEVDEEYDGEGIRREDGAMMPTTVFFTSLIDIPSFQHYKYLYAPQEYTNNISFILKGVNQGGYQEALTPWDKLITEILDEKDLQNFISDAEMKAGDVAMDLGLDNYFEASEIIPVVYDYIKKTFVNEEKDDEDVKTFSEYYDKKINDRFGNLLFMMALIREVGFDANIIMTTSRSAGKVKKQFPSPQSIPNMMLFIEADGEEFFIDLTQDFLPWDMPYYELIGCDALVISDAGVQWKKTTGGKRTSIGTTKIDVTLDPSKEKNTAKIELTGTGYKAQRYKSSYKVLTEMDSLHLFKKSWEESTEREIIGDMKFEDIKGQKGTPKISFEMEYAFDKENNSFVPLDQFAKREFEGFDAEFRPYPIQIPYKEKSIYELNITLAGGYKFKTLPETKTWKLPDGTLTFDYTVEKTSDTKAKIKVVIDKKETLYPNTAYPDFKKLYGDILDQLETKIEIEK